MVIRYQVTKSDLLEISQRALDADDMKHILVMNTAKGSRNGRQTQD